MELENIQGFVNAVEEWETSPFSKNWKKTFEQIEQTLEGGVPENVKAKLISRIERMIDLLVRVGETYEDIVINTSQLYLFVKELNLNVRDFESFYSKYVIWGAELLSNGSLKEIFENKDMLYLEKIKLAEYIVLLQDGETVAEISKEIDAVVKNYKSILNSDLLEVLMNTKKHVQGGTNG